MYSQYTLYPRKSKLHGKIYYVRFRDPDTGIRLSPKSSGKKTKGAANNWAIQQIKQGKIKSTKYNFTTYTANWFIWEKCPYIKLMRSKGKRFNRSYADGKRCILVKHLLPYFGNYDLSKINVPIIEKFLLTLIDKGYSSSTISSIYYTLSIILKEAYRQDIIEKNPMLKIENVKKVTAKKDIIPKQIADEIFSLKNKDKYWDNEFHFLFNLIAYTTGLRQGEILALQKCSIEDNYINVKYNWDRKYGLKSPKYNSNRIIPLPSFTKTCIDNYILKNGITDDEMLLFHGEDFYKAIDHKAVNKHFKKALEKTDLDLSTLNITFHSWRHTFNTIMRGNISDEKLRKITGHKSEAMTDHYTHYNNEAFNDVRIAENKIFEEINNQTIFNTSYFV